jgi:ABC-2 type transport system ATP-binding protein
VIVDLPRVANDRSNAASRPVLAVRDAVKSFGAVQALKGATLELREGELLGLLGPNGAGKTTLIRALTGRIALERGAIEIFGENLPAAERRRHLGIVPQEIALYPLLTARENLEAFGLLHGVARAKIRDRVEWALDWTRLGDRANEPIKSFSGGMKRRLNLACGVLHEPRVVLLDEPTVGVDPQSRERIYEMLDGLKQRGASLLLTTHQLEEAEGRCDRIAILDRGTLIASGSLAELVERTVGGDRVVAFRVDPATAVAPEGFAREDEGRVLTATVRDVAAELPPLLERLRRAGIRIEDLEVRRHGLHAVFIHLTGKDLRE